MEHHWAEFRWLLCCDLSLQIVCALFKIKDLFNSKCLVLMFPSFDTQSPEALTEAFLCGGIPPLVNEPYPVYARTFGMYMDVLVLLMPVADFAKRRS